MTLVATGSQFLVANGERERTALRVGSVDLGVYRTVEDVAHCAAVTENKVHIYGVVREPENVPKVFR